MQLNAGDERVNARLFYLALCVLVLAGIVHISIVLMVPVYGNRDAARLLISDTPLTRFVTETRKGNSLFSEGDPFFDNASCRYDLGQSGLLVTGDETDVFWSLAVFNNRGRVVYSLNRKSAIGNRLNMIVVNPVQMARLRQFDPERLETSIVVETRQTSGFVVVRVLRRDAQQAPDINRFLGSLSCIGYLEGGQV